MSDNFKLVGRLKTMGKWVKRFHGLEPDVVITKIMRYFHKVHRPIYLGELSIDLGFSLTQTENFIYELIDRGIIRQASVKEIYDIGGRSDSFVFVLIGPHNPKLEYKA